MTIPSLSNFTSARVALGRSGNALPTTELLKLQLAHARAREAVHSKLDVARLALDLNEINADVLSVHTAVPSREMYLKRPDLGRRLHAESRRLLLGRKGQFDVAFVVADGLSAVAVQRHAPAVIKATLRLLTPSEWRVAPLVIVEQGRVAIGDEIGDCLGSALAVMLIGERPGLSSFDSLGLYLTWHPQPGLTDAHRNCISNVRDEGLSYEVAAHKLSFLMNESRQRKLSGVELKEDAKRLRPIKAETPASL